MLCQKETTHTHTHTANANIFIDFTWAGLFRIDLGLNSLVLTQTKLLFKLKGAFLES